MDNDELFYMDGRETDDDEEGAELFQLQQYDARIEAERRQDAQVSRAAADYLAGGD